MTLSDSWWSQFFSFGTAVGAAPNWHAPRLLFPMHSDDPWGKTALYPAFRPRARLYRLSVRARAAAGLVPVRVARSEQTLLSDLAQAIGADIASAVILVGHGKVVAELRDPRARRVGYLKYPISTAARSRINRERQVLRQAPPEVAPRVLPWGAEDPARGLLLEPVPGSRLGAGLPRPELMDAWQRALLVGGPVAIEEHPIAAELRSMPPSADSLGILKNLGRRRWPVVLRHGDLAPWNLMSDGTGLRAIDWEYGGPDGLPYLDGAYFVLRVSCLVHRTSPSAGGQRAIAYLQGHRWLTLGRDEAEAIVRVAAYMAYRDSVQDGAEHDEWIRQWLRRIWDRSVRQ